MTKKYREKMIRFSLLLMVGLILFSPGAFAESHYTIIKKPVPTMKEKNFVKLEKVGEIADEVAKDVFLFLPFSMAMDDQNFLYVYDLMQARILIFNPSFDYVSSLGGVGSGPGEFNSTGRSAHVTLHFGLDGWLYANDRNARKVLAFDTKKRKHIKDIRYASRNHSGYFLDELPVDRDGNLILSNFRNNELIVFNDKDKVLYTLPHKEQKKEVLFFDRKMRPSQFGTFPPEVPFSYMIDELELKYTRREVLLVYFPLSATLVTVPPAGKPKQFRVWVDRAITDLYKLWTELKDESVYAPLFGSFFLDGDDPDFIYFSGTGSPTILHFYKVDLDGELIAVMTAPRTRRESPRFLLKKNKIFFAIVNEKIEIYKE